MDFSDPQDAINSKKFNERERDDRARELEDFRWIMSTKEGRRFIRRMIERCHLYKTSFTGNNTTFYLEGERNIGILLLAELNSSCPEQYGVMMKEHTDSLMLRQMEMDKEKQDA